MDNQTDPADLSAVTPTTQGTGVFLVPDVTSDAHGAATKVVVEDITYPECVRRGQFVLAFKWVPTAAMSASRLRQVQCSGPCVRTCVQKGCVCNPQRGFCQ